MKHLLLSTTLVVLALSSSAAFAGSGQKDQGKNDKHRSQQNRQDDRRDDRHERRVDRRDDRYDRRDNRRQPHAFSRGQRLPAAYMHERYYVQDYRSYRLAPPPRGYRWVRPADDRYLLVQTTTGLISQMLGY